MASARLPTIAGSAGMASEIYLPSISSAKPLPPGVGLIIIIIHVTSCRANIRKWSFMKKNATRTEFTTQYLEVHERNVAVKALIQNEKGFFFNSYELSTMSSPALTAESFHRLKTGSLKNQMIVFLFLQDQ